MDYLMNLNQDIQNLLHSHLLPFMADESLSHRAVGDMIEHLSSKIISNQYQAQFTKSKSKKSVDDFSISVDKIKHLFDIKSHHINESGFSMPNLISVKRLIKLLKDEELTLNYIFIDYKRKEGKVEIAEIKIIPIWELDWNCLSIGALGYGQIQISNKNKPIITTQIGRNEWKNILKKQVINFYCKQIVKYEKQMKIWSC
jgi:hypothetical protein